jgi:hypothetical protein
MTLEELERRLRVERGFELHLMDVAPDADLRHLFMLWDGEYTTDYDGRGDTAVLRFWSANTLKQVMAKIGSGYRGKFKVNWDVFPNFLAAVVSVTMMASRGSVPAPLILAVAVPVHYEGTPICD